MVSFIGAGPGDPELLTIKGKKLIDSADVIIYAGSLVNPQVLAVDEITAPEDVAALCAAAGCGVTVLATAHGENREDLLRRAVYAPLWERGLFRRLVTIRRGQTGREYVVEELN